MSRAWLVFAAGLVVLISPLRMTWATGPLVIPYLVWLVLIALNVWSSRSSK